MRLEPFLLLLHHALYLPGNCLVPKNADESLFVFGDVVTVHVVRDEVCLTTRLHLLFGIRNGVRVVIILGRCRHQDTLVSEPDEVVYVIRQLLLFLQDLSEGTRVY